MAEIMAETPTLLLCRLLREPKVGATLLPAQWSAVLRRARREGMAGMLAHRLRVEGAWDGVPAQVRAILADVEIGIARTHVVAGWEARQVVATLASLKCPVILLKGSAYALAGLGAGKGRAAGDLDILIPRSYLGAAEAALQEAGWGYVHTDSYDLHYYRTWMHELPPMIHDVRGTELDVHHTILPLTTRERPDAKALMQDAVVLPNAPLAILAPADMVLHSAAHLFYDGDLVKPLRNLWDIHALAGEFAQDPEFWPALEARAITHGLSRTLAYALRYARRLFGTAVPQDVLARSAENLPAWPVLWLMDRLYLAVFTGRGPAEASLGERAARLLLLARSHWLKMPPMMLARHLWTKWRRGKALTSRPAPDAQPTGHP